jgi:hypothetical protein
MTTTSSRWAWLWVTAGLAIGACGGTDISVATDAGPGGEDGGHAARDGGAASDGEGADDAPPSDDAAQDASQGDGEAGTTDLAAYAGTYTGTYSGQDSGMITLTIDTSGAIALAVHSYLWGNFVGTGTLGTDGSASAKGAGVSVTFTVEGTFAPGAGSGTWVSSNGGAGSWSASRP